MKIPWKLISAFYFPLHLAFGSFYLSYEMLNGKTDCRNCSFCNAFSCADQTSLFWSDLFFYIGLGLVVFSIILPSIISYRNEKVIESSILKEI